MLFKTWTTYKMCIKIKKHTKARKKKMHEFSCRKTCLDYFVVPNSEMN